MKGKHNLPTPTVGQETSVVIVRSFRHWRTGKIIHAKPGKVFRFVVKR